MRCGGAGGEGPNEEESETTVHLEPAMRQMSMQMELPLETRGEALRGKWSGEAVSAVQGDERSGVDDLMGRVVERDNLVRALKRVRQNKGSAGIDGMTVEELPEYLRGNWERIRAELLAGSYQPMAVRRQEIPKSGGGVRQLGIPTVLDRFIQQAILQVLQPIFDPTFSEHSYGFRPGRKAHDGVCQAQRYVQSGRHWVVDVDLEKFFDRVNHDILMSRLERRIADKRLLGVIRRYLEAGIMANGVVVERYEGTPQGGPLSPLLANVLLDEVDRMLEGSGHRFVRYADDCNVYVRSKRAGERVMERMVKLYVRLKLRINEEKSTVAPVWERKFLGYSFWLGPRNLVKRRVAPKALQSFKERIRTIADRNGGRTLASMVEELRSYLLGWKAYFRLADTAKEFRSLDRWIARRLRMVQLKQWKQGTTVYRELRRRGVPERDARGAAAHAHRWWKTANHGALHLAISEKYLEGLGLPRLAPY